MNTINLSDEEEIIRLMRRTPYQDMLGDYSRNSFVSTDDYIKWIKDNDWTVDEFTGMHYDNKLEFH